MNQEQKAQINAQQLQEKREKFQEGVTTFATELVKGIATGGLSLGMTLQNLSIKGAMKQGIQATAKQGLKKTAIKTGKVVGEAALKTADKMDNQDDDIKMEVNEAALSLLTRGRL